MTMTLTPEQQGAIRGLSDMLSDELDELIEYDAHLDDEEQEVQFTEQGEMLLKEFLKQHLGYDAWVQQGRPRESYWDELRFNLGRMTR